MKISAALAKIRMMVWVKPAPNVASDLECILIEETFLSCRFTHASWFNEATSLLVYHNELLFVVALLPHIRSIGCRNEEKRDPKNNQISHQWLDKLSHLKNMLNSNLFMIYLLYQSRYIKLCNTPLRWKSGIRLCSVLTATTPGYERGTYEAATRKRLAWVMGQEYACELEPPKFFSKT